VLKVNSVQQLELSSWSSTSDVSNLS